MSQVQALPNFWDINGKLLKPNRTYQLKTGGNSLVIEITSDGESFVPALGFFAGFFRIAIDPIRIDSLTGHCSFEPYRIYDDE